MTNPQLQVGVHFMASTFLSEKNQGSLVTWWIQDLVQEVVMTPEYLFIPETEDALKDSGTNCKRLPLAKNRGHLSNKKRNNKKGVRYIKYDRIHEFNVTLKQIPYDLLEAVGEPTHDLENINKGKNKAVSQSFLYRYASGQSVDQGRFHTSIQLINNEEVIDDLHFATPNDMDLGRNQYLCGCSNQKKTSRPHVPSGGSAHQL